MNKSFTKIKITAVLLVLLAVPLISSAQQKTSNMGDKGVGSSSIVPSLTQEQEKILQESATPPSPKNVVDGNSKLPGVKSEPAQNNSSLENSVQTLRNIGMITIFILIVLSGAVIYLFIKIHRKKEE